MTVPSDGKRKIGEQMCIQLSARKGHSLDGYQDDSWHRAVRFHYRQPAGSVSRPEPAPRLPLHVISEAVALS